MSEVIEHAMTTGRELVEKSKSNSIEKKSATSASNLAVVYACEDLYNT